eukprot:795256-Pleurochrysis_carterae.AAC.1
MEQAVAVALSTQHMKDEAYGGVSPLPALYLLSYAFRALCPVHRLIGLHHVPLCECMQRGMHIGPRCKTRVLKVFLHGCREAEGENALGEELQIIKERS